MNVFVASVWTLSAPERSTSVAFVLLLCRVCVSMWQKCHLEPVRQQRAEARPAPG